MAKVVFSRVYLSVCPQGEVPCDHCLWCIGPQHTAWHVQTSSAWTSLPYPLPHMSSWQVLMQSFLLVIDVWWCFNCHIRQAIRRLHSSRMHTAYLLTVSRSMHCAEGWGGGYGVSAPVGCLLTGGPWSEGVPGPGVVSQHALGQTPCEQNHRML